MHQVRLGPVAVVWLVALLALGHGAAPPAVAQDPDCSPWLDPAALLLDEGELPAGFVHRRERDEVVVEHDLVALARFYARATGKDGAGDEPWLEIFVGIMPAPDEAVRLFEFTVRVLERSGYVFESPEVVLGDRAVVGRRAADEPGGRDRQRLMVWFRVGQVLAAVRWHGDTGGWGLDAALVLARRLDIRLAELGPTRAAPEGCAARSLARILTGVRGRSDG